MALFAPAALQDISDDVLLLIFSYLKSWDLIQVSETCERFSKVARDKSLWTNVDFSPGCLSLQQLWRWLSFLRQNTRRLVLRGFKKRFAGTPRWKTPLISPSLLKSIGEKCPDLEQLTLCEALIDAKKFKITDFLPVKSIKKLCLIDCEFVNLPSPLVEGSYFKRTHKILTNLEYLKITKCNSIDDYDVMVLSKIDTLKSLVLRNLPKVGRAMAYIALGFRFGFQNIEDLDLRGTSLQDNEVLSVVQNGKLRSLYLGPIGPVKRLPEEPSREHNLVMPDPRWQEERHQVVVINVGPNGPVCRQVNDEELDGMGLQWVRNAPVVQRHRAEEEDEDRHYFIGRDGRPVEHEEENNDAQSNGDDNEENNDADGNNQKDVGNSSKDPSSNNGNNSGAEKMSTDTVKEGNHSSKSAEGVPEGNKTPNDNVGCSRKRKREDDDVDGEEDDAEVNEEEIHASYEVAHYDVEDEHLAQEPYQEPDECLSDNLVRAFGPNTKLLQTLVISGCAISDNGLQSIMRQIPSLKYLDVTNTKVTSNGLEMARALRPQCVLLGGGTRIVRQNER